MAENRVITHTSSSPALVLRELHSLLTFRLPSTTVTGASLMIFKAIVGVGLFALPYAFRLLGYNGAILTMAAVGMLTFYTGIVVIRVHDVVVRDTLAKGTTYVSLAQYCFGNWAARTVYGLVVFTTLGCNGAFLVFIGSVLHSVWPSVPLIVFSGLTALSVLPLVLLRNTKFLTYASVVGNIGVGLVVLAVIVRGAEVGDIRPLPEYIAFAPQNFMQAFGIIGFLYACSTTLVTIEKSMVHRDRFSVAYLQTIVFVFFACSGFGLLNYLYYGPDVCSIVIINLGDGPLALLGKLAIVVDLAFTYPISMAAAREIVEKSLLTELTPSREAKRTGIRVAMVLCAFSLAFFPNFGLIVNLIGGVSVSALSFILPPLMLLQLRRFHLAAHARQVAYMHTAGLVHDSPGALPPAFATTSSSRAAASRGRVGFLDHVFNTRPLAPDAALGDGGEVENSQTFESVGKMRGTQGRQFAWQRIAVAHPKAPRAASSHVSVQRNHPGLVLVVAQTEPFGVRCVSSPPQAHRYREERGDLAQSPASLDPHALLGSIAVGPLAFNPRFATLSSGDHVIGDALEPEGTDVELASASLRVASDAASYAANGVPDVTFSQPHSNRGTDTVLLGSRGGREVPGHPTTFPSSALTMPHDLMLETEEAMAALRRILLQVHWPALPALFPLLQQHPNACSPPMAVTPPEMAAQLVQPPPRAPRNGLEALSTAPGIVGDSHSHCAPLVVSHSSFDVLAESDRAEDAVWHAAAAASVEDMPSYPLPHRRPKLRAGRRGSIIAHIAQRRRHMVALQLLGVGSRMETVFLLAVVVFGVVMLVMTTAQTLLQASGAVSNAQPAICTA